MAEINFDEVLQLMLAVAHEAGDMILDANPAHVARDTKANCGCQPAAVPVVVPPVDVLQARVGS